MRAGGLAPAPGRNVNPWFSVIDRETFQLNVEGIVEGTGPTGFEPNYTSVEYYIIHILSQYFI
jgi:hypothetical protein